MLDTGRQVLRWTSLDNLSEVRQTSQSGFVFEKAIRSKLRRATNSSSAKTRRRDELQGTNGERVGGSVDRKVSAIRKRDACLLPKDYKRVITDTPSPPTGHRERG